MKMISHPEAGAGHRAECFGAAHKNAFAGRCLPIMTLLTVLLMLIVAGCTTVPADLGRSDVESLLEDRGREHAVVAGGEQVSDELERLTSAPLTPESSVRITFLNSPAVTAEFAKLGFGAADLYEAGRINNPVLSAAFLDANVSGEKDQITYGLAVSFTDLLTLSSRKRLSEGAFAALKQSIGAHAMRFAADTEASYYRYVSALQVARLREQTAIAAGLSASMTERYHAAGNVTARDLAMQQAEASEARLRAMAAEAESERARKELATALGLSSGGNWTVPDRLPIPGRAEKDLEALLKLAEASRLDLAAANANAQVLADRLGVINWTRWLGDVDLGIEHERETSGTRLTGPTVGLEVPIFNTHRDSLYRADAELQSAVAEVRRVRVEVDNSVRLAYRILENARARVEETRDVLIPQRIEAVAQAQAEANFMLTSVFELIRLKQLEYDAYQLQIESIRDYWLQRSALGFAVGSALPGVDDAQPDSSIDAELATPHGETHEGGAP